MLIDTLKLDLKNAMFARNQLKTSVLRMLLSELNYAKISKGTDLSDEDISSLIQKEVKKRQESIVSFKQGGREDLAEKESQEAEILKIYLPEQLSDTELTKIIEETINKMGAVTVQDMGKVIGAVVAQVKGKADGGRVSALVKEKLDKS